MPPQNYMMQPAIGHSLGLCPQTSSLVGYPYSSAHLYLQMTGRSATYHNTLQSVLANYQSSNSEQPWQGKKGRGFDYNAIQVPCAGHDAWHGPWVSKDCGCPLVW